MEICSLTTAFDQIVSTRRSVRGFKAEPVPATVLQSVFSLAQQCPSNCNTQPWIVHVVSGEKCNVLSTKISEAILLGQWTMDFPYDGKYTGLHKERQYDAAQQLYTAMGIAREDKAKRAEAFARNFSFFGAPHVAFLFIPEQFGMREAADLGMYAQTLMLSLVARGLASCPQTALSFCSDLVRAELGVDNNLKLMFGISFGYEDPEEAANSARVGKAPLQQVG
jgi:nitroreductase